MPLLVRGPRTTFRGRHSICPESKKMKKRLRKKTHRGEFAQYALPVRFQFVSGFSETDADRFIDEFLGFIESINLYFGGGGGSEGWDGFFDMSKPGDIRSASEPAVEWLRNHPQVVSVETDEPMDAWYGNHEWPDAK